MYTPKHFSAPGEQALLDLIRTYPFATLVTTAASGLEVNHLPLYLEDKGILSGHVARANPLWQGTHGLNEVMAIFHGPHAYVTPAWYPTKAQTGMVVPTWNYVVVHARGKLRVIEDANCLRAHLTALTAQQEAAFEQPWQLEDAPAGFIDKLMQAVVGIEIEITELTGKWKLSQNQSPENQVGVLQGLSAGEDVHGREIAELVKVVNCLTVE
ncbi:FMN-binding negative transcriptional regulator [Methylophilus sp. UBA6697]|jgi:transcriptional regulator|uniref:FMN-binding negative transcriptional regulator n=1 Tax=Methylophilus sp. UBA6697 TaxID=1946902 RepID=UPI0025CD298A|nr:FMN-binding negative transcriptional regulator [Methylophilus sp. UBA6697]